MKINHAAIEDKWLNDKVMNLLYNSNKIVLGSFNTHNPKNNTDFYYGRCSNFFWKVIAQIEGKNDQYYFNNIQLKIGVMEKYSFCCLDLIDSIEISSTNGGTEIISDFVKNKIYTGYSDSVLFSSNTSYKNKAIRVDRTYNKLVLDVLDKGKITKVIHTLGNARISEQFVTKPIEKSLQVEGFQGYWLSIVNRKKDIEIVRNSYSPSAYAVRRLGEQNYESIKSWFETNLIQK